MNKFKYFLISLVFLSFSVQAQILNGTFEEWTTKNEPENWGTNNMYDEEKNELYIMVTKSSNSHSGLYAVKGEVFDIPQSVPPEFTISPFLRSVNFNDPEMFGHPFTRKPKQVRGYYNYQSVGGDVFVVYVLLYSGKVPIAYASASQDTSTGIGYHELILDFVYTDTIKTPTSIMLTFQIIPPDGGLYAHAGSMFLLDDFPSISLLKPPGDSNPPKDIVFISGEVDTIKWYSGGVQNIDLEYSDDNGVTYTNIVSNYPADSNRYKWKVPKTLLSRKGKIRIIDSKDKENKEESITFSFKPWQLTRIKSDNKFELFIPNKHGWSIKNSDPNIWSQDWWQKFDYKTGTDSYLNKQYPAFHPFITAKSSIYPDWPIFVDVFKPEQCYPNNYYGAKALHGWAGIRDTWDGSCVGFTVTSLLGFYHKGSLASLIGNFENLYSVSINDDSRYAINYYYIHQFGKEASVHESAASTSVTPRMLLKDLKAMFRKENGDGKPLYFNSNNSSGGHAVTPYKLERIGKTSRFRLKVYDSNSPGSTDDIILIDSTVNTWTDNTGLGWGTGSLGCFLARESGAFLSRPTLPDLTNDLMAINKSTNSSSKMTIHNTSNADIMITFTNGDQIGFQDSVAFNDVNDGLPIIPLTGSFHPPIGYYLPSDNYSLQMNKFTDSLSYVFFMTDSTIYNYRRFNSLNNESDILNYSENGVGIINPDQINKSIDLESIIIQDSTSEKVFVTSNIEVSANDSIHIREKDRSELLLQNYGESSKYDLQIRTVSAKGQSIFNRAEILLPKNSSHQIVPVWENLEEDPVKILIDNGNDGTFDDSLIVTNEVTGIEKNNYVGIPKEYKLLQNYPNPFNPSTTISFELPQKSEVNLTIYNTLGQVVATLINEIKQAGQHQIVFDASHLPNGVYIYRIKAGSYSAAKKMILLK